MVSKRAKVQRKKKNKNPDLYPVTKIENFGFSKILSRIDNAIEILSRRS
ncbi:hypothetical protein [Neobacillus sp. D3-1R]